MEQRQRHRYGLRPWLALALLCALLVLPAMQHVHAAAFTVTDTSDDPADTGSLRYAVNHYAAGDVIGFAPGVSGTITLANGTLMLMQDVTIIGPGAATLAVDGGYTGGATGVQVLKIIGTVAISGLTIQHGSSTDAGGGIENYGVLALTDCAVSGNVAATQGGGIATEGVLTLTRTLVNGNSAGGNGGGLYSRNTATLLDSTLLGNAAPNGGGGGIENERSVTMTGTTIRSNTADSGAGILNLDARLTVTNSTISGNYTTPGSTGYGAAILNGTGRFSHSATTVTSSTISDNDGNRAIYNFNQFSIGSSIVANSPFGYNFGGPVTDLDYNLISNTTGATGLTGPHDLLNVNPQLYPFADNGGPTQTQALDPRSPAIDRIPPSACAVATDQRGIHRPQGVGCDIGAFEATTTPLPPTRPPAPTAVDTPAPLPTARATPPVPQPTPRSAPPTAPPGAPTPNPLPPPR